MKKVILSVLALLTLAAPLFVTAATTSAQPSPVSLPGVACPADAEIVSAIVRFPIQHLTADEVAARVGNVSAVIWEWGDDQTLYPIPEGRIPSEEIRSFLKANISELITDTESLVEMAVAQGEPDLVVANLKGQIASYRRQLEFLGGDRPLAFAAVEVTGGPDKVKSIKGGTVAACVSLKDKSAEKQIEAVPTPSEGGRITDYPEYRPYTGTVIWRPAQSYMDNFFRWRPEDLDTFTGNHTGFEFDVKRWPSQMAECKTVTSWDAPFGEPRTYECKGPVTTNVPASAQWYYDTRYKDPTGDWVEKDFTQGIENAGNLDGYVTYHFKVSLKNINPNLVGLIFIDRQLQGDPRTSLEDAFCKVFRVYMAAPAACNFAYANEPERMSFQIEGDAPASHSW